METADPGLRPAAEAIEVQLKNKNIVNPGYEMEDTKGKLLYTTWNGYTMGPDRKGLEGGISF